MHIHILGICGTFMGSLAQLAKAAGHQVSGCDANVYPPMSTQLEQAGIVLIEGFDPVQLHPAPDLIVVGNALSRGNPCVEAMLDQKIPYISGPQWLGETFLRDKQALSVAGTHGKTTTSSMLAKILDSAGLQPGFLIGGVPEDFGVSARLSDSDYFVVEADEYDSAFFDKRSKFVHYFTSTLVINNLEFDHADIFDDLAAIQRQFHHCVRTVPSSGSVIYPADNANVAAVIEQGCWSQQVPFGDNSDWQYQLLAEDGSQFSIQHRHERAVVSWGQTGLHNVTNGMAAAIAAHQVGVSLQQACAALCDFVGVKRRMEVIYKADGITVYDDFAHHPTAIKTTTEGLRAKVGRGKIIAVIEPRSATMRLGIHQHSLVEAVASADQVFWYQNPRIDWDIHALADACAVSAKASADLEQLLALVTDAIGTAAASQETVDIVIMSNGGFEGFHQLLVERLG
jgi:UDP-N-acetylmuramate: L-alanyl-gamma-D-glutamyl-meso-diaminopimelate ligase